MMFCPKCGALMISIACKCGYSSKDKSALELKEEVKLKEDKIDIIDDQEDSLLPETDAECPKCKHTKAVFWLIQTRAGDEPETKFLKCKKCKYTWRDYK
ncbi:MAG: transcription factor S [Candidatus Woesearchaeota archaeon]